MTDRKSNCSIGTINLRALERKKFSLNHFLNKKFYNVDEIYGTFSDDHTFCFVRENSIPYEEWEEVQDKSPFTYYELVHKKKYQLFSMEDGSYLTDSYVGNIPWQQGESIEILGHRIIPICARKFIPKNFIQHNQIEETELKRFSNFITRILAMDSSLLKDYFPPIRETQRTV